jgi:hypothetical protein
MDLLKCVTSASLVLSLVSFDFIPEQPCCGIHYQVPIRGTVPIERSELEDMILTGLRPQLLGEIG